MCWWQLCVALTCCDADQLRSFIFGLCAAFVVLVAAPPMRLLALSPQVPHVRQHYNWDCGLACVLMVLRAMGVHGIDFYTLRQCCGTTRCEDLLDPGGLVEGAAGVDRPIMCSSIFRSSHVFGLAEDCGG